MNQFNMELAQKKNSQLLNRILLEQMKTNKKQAINEKR